MGGGNEEELQRMLPQPKIAPSMLSSDFANLASEAKFMEQCGADWLHMDIMVKTYTSRELQS
jgi:ribulose-phosphate 3-epimerase